MEQPGVLVEVSKKPRMAHKVPLRNPKVDGSGIPKEVAVEFKCALTGAETPSPANQIDSINLTLTIDNPL